VPIGEIRDHETAQIAVEAALTGHLVLSTLHTNDAPSAVTRLTEMGIAQRLARFPWRPGEELPVLFRAVGCSSCAKTGYKGRLALHEVMSVSEEILRVVV